MSPIELPLGISLTPVTAAYILIIGFLTEAIMKVTPASFDKNRFGQLISIGVAMVISVVDGIATHLGASVVIIRGFIFAFLSNGGYDLVKSIVANVKPGGGS
jgi:hypothetical protein